MGALGRYYALKGVDGYFNDEGKGKFIVYCDDNGLDEEELNEDDPEQNMLVEFVEDDDFPGVDSDDAQRLQKIFTIIKKCADQPDAFKDDDEKYEALQITKDDWIITQKKQFTPANWAQTNRHCNELRNIKIDKNPGKT